MTIRRRLVALTALCVGVPLVAGALVLALAGGAALRARSQRQLETALRGERSALVVRQQALQAAVGSVASRPGLDPTAAVAALTSTGEADGAAVSGPGPATPPGGAVLSARAPRPDGTVLVGWVTLGPSLLAQLAPAADVRFSMTPPVGPGLQRAEVPLPGGAGTLFASRAASPTPAREREWQALLAGLVVAVVLGAVLVADLAAGAVARPLERLVGVTAPTGAPVDTGAGVEQVVGAFQQVVRDLRTRDHELEQTRVAFRQAIDRLGDVLAATHDQEAIEEAIVETTLLVVPADVAVYYRGTGRPGSLQAVRARGVVLDRLALDGVGVAGHAALTGQVTTLPGPAPLAPDEPPAVAAAAVPVRSDDRLIGVLGAYGTTVGRPFTEDEVGSLHTLVRQAEVAIANIHLHAQAQREALTDGVTGLWNRRHFDLRCRDAHASSARFGEPYGVVLFDIDDFKQINDRFDHFTGDAALVHLAEVLRRSSRDVDVVARWGGEEFAVLVQRAGLAEAVMVAQRALDDLRRSPLEYRGQLIPFTASAGVASNVDATATAAQVVAAADAALLRAKAAGKDRVEWAGAAGPAPQGAPARPEPQQPGAVPTGESRPSP